MALQYCNTSNASYTTSSIFSWLSCQFLSTYVPTFFSLCSILMCLTLLFSCLSLYGTFLYFLLYLLVSQSWFYFLCNSMYIQVSYFFNSNIFSAFLKVQISEWNNIKDSKYQTTTGYCRIRSWHPGWHFSSAYISMLIFSLLFDVSSTFIEHSVYLPELQLAQSVPLKSLFSSFEILL